MKRKLYKYILLAALAGCMITGCKDKDNDEKSSAVSEEKSADNDNSQDSKESVDNDNSKDNKESEKKGTLTDQGYAAMENGNYKEAMSLFSSALTDSDDPKLIKRGMGMASLAMYDYDTAKGYFKDALSYSNGIIKDEDIDISYYLAVAEYKSGDSDAAVKTYDSIIALRPEEDNAYYMRGKIYLLADDKEKALADYEQAVTLAPDDYDHYLRICEDLRKAGYDNEGDAYLRRAMENNSKLSNYQLGIFNYYLGNYTEARNNLENARKDKKKQGEDLIMYLGKTYEALGDPGYAISLYEEYISEGNQAADACLNLGLVKISQRDYQGAIDAFERGLAYDDVPCRQSLLYNRIVAYESLYDFKTAKSLMEEYVSEYPSDEKAQRENIFLSTR